MFDFFKRGSYDDMYDDDEDYSAEQAMVARNITTVATPQIVKPFAAQPTKIPKTINSQEILSITMSEYNATGEIASYIKNGRSVIVNMEKLSDPEIQRALDYLSGVSFALDGSVQLLTPKMYVMLPEHMKLSNK